MRLTSPRGSYWRHRRRMLLVPLLFLCVASAAQRPGRDEVRISSRAYRPGPMTIHTNVVSIEVDAVVRDRHGEPVPGLGQGNFRLYNDGRPQSFSGFSVAAAPRQTPAGASSRGARGLPAPPQAGDEHRARYLALFFDDVNSGAGDLGHARDAARQFLTRALRGRVRVAIFTASSSQSVGFTRDRKRLLAAIAALRAHPRATRYSTGCVHITAYQAYLIVNHLDPAALAAAEANTRACAQTSNGAIIFGANGPAESEGGAIGSIWLEARAASQATLAAIQDVVGYLGRQPGSRVLVIASGGFLGQTLEAVQDQIIQEALRQRVTIDGLDAGGLYAGGPGLALDQQEDVGVAPLAMFEFDEESRMPEHEAMDAAMANLAQSTGGILFQNNNDLALGFERLGLVASVTYRLSFAPAGIVADGKLHRIRVKVVPDHGYTIEARRGYFDPPPETPAVKLREAIDAAARGHTAVWQFAASLNASQSGNGVAIGIHVDLARLEFRHEKGRERNRLIFTAALYDSGGRFAAGKQAEMDFALKPQSWQMLRRRGLAVHLNLPAGAGRYTLRVVIAVANKGKLDAMSQPVVIR